MEIGIVTITFDRLLLYVIIMYIYGYSTKKKSPRPTYLSPGPITGANIKEISKFCTFYVTFQGKIEQNLLSSQLKVHTWQLKTFSNIICKF